MLMVKPSAVFSALSLPREEKLQIFIAAVVYCGPNNTQRAYCSLVYLVLLSGR
jgi:hypothetical protein